MAFWKSPETACIGATLFILILFTCTSGWGSPRAIPSSKVYRPKAQTFRAQKTADAPRSADWFPQQNWFPEKREEDNKPKQEEEIAVHQNEADTDPKWFPDQQWFPGEDGKEETPSQLAKAPAHFQDSENADHHHREQSEHSPENHNFNEASNDFSERREPNIGAEREVIRQDEDTAQHRHDEVDSVQDNNHMAPPHPPRVNVDPERRVQEARHDEDEELWLEQEKQSNELFNVPKVSDPERL